MDSYCGSSYKSVVGIRPISKSQCVLLQINWMEEYNIVKLQVHVYS